VGKRLPKSCTYTMLLTENKVYASVSLLSMQHIIRKQIHATITRKGQVSIPAEVRRVLGMSTAGKVVFQITQEGTVLLTVPQYRSIADLAGAAGKLPSPPTEQELKQIAREEREKEAAEKGV
jgi:AbrB family looped-hinge helix DNA binding protein